jgi:hypothetical protein
MPAALQPSKRQINRAGSLLRDLRVALREEGDTAWEHFVGPELDAALPTVEWFRSQHARPLARVNANLRYYIKKAGAHHRQP